MELIFAAALCSVAVSIFLKIAKEKGLIPLQMIVWNYAAASLLCFLWFKPDLTHISLVHTPWVLILSLGILLPSVFLCLAQSLVTVGIFKTEIAQRLSVVLSLIAAYFLFQEQFNSLKILGVILGIIAVLLLLIPKSKNQTSIQSKKGIFVLLGVWGGYAIIDILLKYTTGLGLQFSVVLNLMFICAFILSFVFVLIRYKTFGNYQNILAGLGLGILNFANIALYVEAHLLLKDTPAIVFAAMNILVVMFGVISSICLFREPVKKEAILGFILGIVSVLCLAFAM